MKNLMIWLRWVSLYRLPFLPTTSTSTPLLMRVIKYPTYEGTSPTVKFSTQDLPTPQCTTLSALGKIFRHFPQRVRIHKLPNTTSRNTWLYQALRWNNTSHKTLPHSQKSSYRDEAEGMEPRCMPPALTQRHTGKPSELFPKYEPW